MVASNAPFAELTVQLLGMRTGALATPFEVVVEPLTPLWLALHTAPRLGAVPPFQLFVHPLQVGQLFAVDVAVAVPCALLMLDDVGEILSAGVKIFISGCLFSWALLSSSAANCSQQAVGLCSSPTTSISPSRPPTSQPLPIYSITC
jgi:hypothetical protein